MNRAQRYLVIPSDYARALGGLRWHPDAEAIEYASETNPHALVQDSEQGGVGGTFAMSGEVSLFLRGFGSSERLICFGQILHLLHLFGLSRPGRRLSTSVDPANHLATLFQSRGRPLRNAGALAAWLCRGLPRAVDAPEIEEILSALNRSLSGYESRLFATCSPDLAEVPPLAPAHFEARIQALLGTLSTEELTHWLKFGREPVGNAGQHLASEVESETVRTRSLIERLDTVSKRPRMLGTSSLVPLLSGALCIPSRHREPGELPVGGLSDLSTRGRPESILPHQFALDDLEFLRRFAERELLYFHREPPRARHDVELVLLVDQGARTWGDVRLVLCRLGAGSHAILRFERGFNQTRHHQHRWQGRRSRLSRRR